MAWNYKKERESVAFVLENDGNNRKNGREQLRASVQHKNGTKVLENLLGISCRIWK